MNPMNILFLVYNVPLQTLYSITILLRIYNYIFITITLHSVLILITSENIVQLEEMKKELNTIYRATKRTIYLENFDLRSISSENVK